VIFSGGVGCEWLTDVGQLKWDSYSNLPLAYLIGSGLLSLLIEYHNLVNYHSLFCLPRASQA
jgi:hypothetical protein